MLLAAAAFAHLGGYNVAADAPHTAPVRTLLDSVRDRSIAARARGIVPPSDLARSELSRGLYPQAPELARKSDFSPAEQFWIIKLTAMPAWGKTHSHPLIWNMVASKLTEPPVSPKRRVNQALALIDRIVGILWEFAAL